MNKQSQRAFTLLEILIVVVIISLFAGMVMLSLSPNANRELEREARRLFEVIKLAQDEAIIQDIEMGLTIQPMHYYFSRLEKGAWVQLLEDKHFEQHTLIEGMELSYSIDDEIVVLDEGEELPAPKILLLSSGEVIPFTIQVTLLNHNAIYQIIGQEDGFLSFNNTTAL
jgi:general secretion pathway protein H